MIDRFPFSAYVSKTITPEPRVGNPPPRLWEEPAAMVNSIGLPNKGLDGFLGADLPVLAELPVPLIVSVMATSVEEFAPLVEAVAARDEVAGARAQRLLPERPLWADRRRAAGGDLGADRGAAPADREAADREADSERRRSGGDRHRRRAGRGADAVSLINTLKAAPLLADGRPWLGAGSGGLSGPAVRTIALKQVADVAAAVEIPVVGMGGIERGSHAAALLGAGATVVAVGTACFRDPLAAERIRGELEALRSDGGRTGRKAVTSAIASTSVQAASSTST